MKKGNIILAVCIVVLCVVGWLSLGYGFLSGTAEYNRQIEQADEWVTRGLYQRAIGGYELAAQEKRTPEVYEKIDAAYQLRYAEAPEETIDDYMDFLATAVAAYPGNEVLVNSYTKIFLAERDYQSVYKCLKAAIENGCDTQEIREQLLMVRYAFDYKGSQFDAAMQSVQGVYTTARNDRWNLYSIEEGYLLSEEYTYLSPCSEDGVFVLVGEDSRIMNLDGMVLGIFDAKVNEAGVYAEGLVPVSVNGVYSYYNDFAEKQFGDYEVAGMFQNGKAAVKKDGKWMLIDSKGEVQSGKFEEIVLDYAGRYIIDDVVIAKNNGKYGFYDENMELKATVDCEKIGIYTEDNLVAVCKNGAWGFVDSTGEVLVAPVYAEARSFSNGLAAVKQNSLWGFIDRSGTMVIEPQFHEVGYMTEDGICSVCLKDKESETWKLLKLELGIKED